MATSTQAPKSLRLPPNNDPIRMFVMNRDGASVVEENFAPSTLLNIIGSKNIKHCFVWINGIRLMLFYDSDQNSDRHEGFSFLEYDAFSKKETVSSDFVFGNIILTCYEDDRIQSVSEFAEGMIWDAVRFVFRTYREECRTIFCITEASRCPPEPPEPLKDEYGDLFEDSEFDEDFDDLEENIDIESAWNNFINGQKRVRDSKDSTEAVLGEVF